MLRWVKSLSRRGIEARLPIPLATPKLTAMALVRAIPAVAGKVAGAGTCVPIGAPARKWRPSLGGAGAEGKVPLKREEE